MSIKQLAFKELFTAGSISTPLASVTKHEHEKVKHYFNVENYDVIGFREDDEVVGYLQNSHAIDLNNLDKQMIRFEVSDLITTHTSLIDCLKILKKRAYLFVINGSQVEAIITLADVQKPATRMLLFGLITSFESNLADLINETYPEDQWTSLLSESRVTEAMKTYNGLLKVNKETDLISCTQLCDKTDVFFKSDALLHRYIKLSKSKAKEYFKVIQELRNDLAHAQSLTSWFEEKDVIQLIDDLENMTEKIINRRKLY